MAIARINGGMLQSNLERNGVDIQIDSTLYVDVNNNRIGVNNTNPAYTLDISGNAHIGSLYILGNTITAEVGKKIDLGAIGNLVVTGGASYDIVYTDGAGNLQFGNLNSIAGLETFTGNNIQLGANTVGQLSGNAGSFTNQTTVTNSIAVLNQILGNITNSGGNTIHVTGNVTAGNVSGTLLTAYQPNVTFVGNLANLEVAGNTIIWGNLTVNGNSVTIGSTSLSILDPIINLHTAQDLTPLTSNDGADIGVKFHYYDTVDSAAFLGRANDTGYLEWYSKGTDVSNVFVGTAYGTIKSGELILANLTAATSTTTGALQVSGGIGVVGNVFAGNVLTNNYLFANGTPLTNLTLSNVGTYLTTYTGNITAGNVIVQNTVYANTISANVGNVVTVSGTGALRVPVGTTAQQPTGVSGYIRYNTDTPALEYYNGAMWVPITNTVTDQQIVADGANSVYDLDQTATTIGVIVSINGVLQRPTTAYTISGTYPSCQITFQETPQYGEVIDIRFLGASVTINSTLSDDLAVSGNISASGMTLTSALQFANLTTAQVNTISAPTRGMTVYNYTTGNIQVYNGTKWANVTLS